MIDTLPVTLSAHVAVAVWIIAVCSVLLVAFAWAAVVQLARIRNLADGTVAPLNTRRTDLRA